MRALILGHTHVAAGVCFKDANLLESDRAEQSKQAQINSIRSTGSACFIPDSRNQNTLNNTQVGVSKNQGLTPRNMVLTGITP